MSSDTPTSPLNIPNRRNRSASISGTFGWPISSAAIYGTSPLSPPSTYNRRFSGSWAPTIVGSPPAQSNSVNTDSTSTQTANNTAANATMTSGSPTDISTPSHVHNAKNLSTVSFTPSFSSIPVYSSFTRSKSTSGRTRASTTPSSTKTADYNDDDNHHHYYHHHQQRQHNYKGRFDTVKHEAAAQDRPASPMRNAILTGQFLD